MIGKTVISHTSLHMVVPHMPFAESGKAQDSFCTPSGNVSPSAILYTVVDIVCISLDCGLICRPSPCVIGVGRRTDEVRSAGRMAEPNCLWNFCDREAS
jgi:hypothetical protein